MPKTATLVTDTYKPQFDTSCGVLLAEYRCPACGIKTHIAYGKQPKLHGGRDICCWCGASIRYTLP